MNEKQPEFKPLILEIGEETLEFDRDHASLYTFLGHTAREGSLADYDHVFLVGEEEGEEEGTIENVGMYVFKTKNETFYNECREHLQNNGFPLHLNLNEISHADVAMWRYIHLDDSDEFPEEWCEPM